MNDPIYIVTGAAGHLGSFIVRELLSRGKRVRAFVLPGESCPAFIDINRHLLTEYIGDVCDPDSLIHIFNGVTSDMRLSDGAASDVRLSEGAASDAFIVIHCAGIVAITKKEDRRVYDVNVEGTANVIGACKKYSVKRLVYVSSVHAIPPLPRGQVIREVMSFNPSAVPGYYDKTKAIATQLVLDAAKGGLDATVVHPSGIIGPHGLPTGNMARLITLYVRGKLPTAVRGGYDFVDVRDAANGIISAATEGKGGECYIVSNRFIRLDEIFDTLSVVSGLKKLKVYVPMWIAKAFAPLAEIYYLIARKTPLFTRYSLETLSEYTTYSHEKASRVLHYTTRPLKDTLTDTALWIKAKYLGK